MTDPSPDLSSQRQPASVLPAMDHPSVAQFSLFAHAHSIRLTESAYLQLYSRLSLDAYI